MLREFKKVLIILTAVLVTGVGFLFWYVKKNTLPKFGGGALPSLNQELEKEGTQIREWKLYEVDGFSFEYPKDWKIAITSYPEKEINVFSGDYRLNIITSMSSNECYFQDSNLPEINSISYYDTYRSISNSTMKIRRGTKKESLEKSQSAYWWEVCIESSTIKSKFFTGTNGFDRIIYMTPTNKTTDENMVIMDKILSTLRVNQ